MLENKVAIITGGTRGIGFEVVKAFLKEGANVVLCGSKEQTVNYALENLLEYQTKVIGTTCDLTSDEDANRIVNLAITKFGHLDILVNNAGITDAKEIEKTTIEEIEKMFTINVYGPLRMIKAALPYLKKEGGSIINTSSMVSLYGGKHQAPYAASKSALNGITKSLAKELGEFKIRVNAIAPGVINTDMMSNAVNEQMQNALINMTPLKKMGEPKDLVGAYLYLASDQASFTTGAIIQVDGGLIM